MGMQKRAENLELLYPKCDPRVRTAAGRKAIMRERIAHQEQEKRLEDMQRAKDALGAMEAFATLFARKV